MTETKTAESVLRSAPGTDDVRAAAYDAFVESADENDLADRLKSVNIPDSAKSDLWELKHEIIASHVREFNTERQTKTIQQLQAAKYPSAQERGLKPGADLSNRPLYMRAADALMDTTGNDNGNKVVGEPWAPPIVAGGISKGVPGDSTMDVIRRLVNMPMLPDRLVGMARRVLGESIPAPAPASNPLNMPGWVENGVTPMRPGLTEGTMPVQSPPPESSVTGTTVPWESMRRPAPSQIGAGSPYITGESDPINVDYLMRGGIHDMPPGGGMALPSAGTPQALPPATQDVQGVLSHGPSGVRDMFPPQTPMIPAHVPQASPLSLPPASSVSMPGEVAATEAAAEAPITSKAKYTMQRSPSTGKMRRVFTSDSSGAATPAERLSILSGEPPVHPLPAHAPAEISPDRVQVFLDMLKGIDRSKISDPLPAMKTEASAESEADIVDKLQKSIKAKKAKK